LSPDGGDKTAGDAKKGRLAVIRVKSCGEEAEGEDLMWFTRILSSNGRFSATNKEVDFRRGFDQKSKKEKD